MEQDNTINTWSCFLPPPKPPNTAIHIFPPPPPPTPGTFVFFHFSFTSNWITNVTFSVNTLCDYRNTNMARCALPGPMGVI
ncbi:hypothetical protein E2C01_080254 [Portunus trituberculatus]|uniref:Uncharacterized protein n=1 Tax=Portunus trituberculatus TaxID=210409 RepID=A0A5B7IUX7_PORTR|nr:hypothetical protein [Portunus trituberculatus]